MKLFAKNLRALLASKKRSSEKGQSLAEMVLGMTILVMLMSGVVDIGRAYFAYVALEDAAGEAALYMSAYPECPYDGVDGSTELGDATSPLDTTGTECEPPDNAIFRAVHAGGAGGLLNWSDSTKASFDIYCIASSVITPCSLAQTGDTVVVRIDYKFPLLSPMIPDIISTGEPFITLSGIASQTITAPTTPP